MARDVFRNSPLHNRCRITIENVQSYMNRSGATINGKTYGSEKAYVREENKQKLLEVISERHMLQFAELWPLSIDDTAELYLECRKGCWERHRDKMPITRSDVYLPLFGEIEKHETVSTIYAYIGRNQILDGRAVKIGYTDQELIKYLNTKKREHDPWLVATKCGSYREEQKEHQKWGMYRAEGREWYWYADRMFQTFRDEWDVVVDFDNLMEKARQLCIPNWKEVGQ